jgi:hypothetical protein
MQAVEIRIPGQFWDSFIYNGDLYLFTLNGDIKVYSWDHLVSSVAVDADCRPLLWQFLARGQTWYKPELQKLLESPKIYTQIRELSDKIAAQPFELSEKILRGALIETAASPSHPHTDVEAFYNALYLSSSSGIRAARLTRKLSNNFTRLSDIPALRVACSYGSMAVAAGSEGMYDQTLTSSLNWPATNEPRQLSDRNCVACSWAAFDVIGSSGPGDAGFIAAFSKPEKEEAEQGPVTFTGTSRQLLDIVGSDDLFPSSDGLLFGAENLLVMASPSHLYIDNWNPYLRRKDQGVDVQRSLFNEKEFEVDDLAEEAIDGAATVFGIAVEMDSALIVRGVDGSISGFGEPVNWRTYPRSRRYLNQLHITYDEYVSIFAFLDDYFVSDEDREPAVQRPRWRRG